MNTNKLKIIVLMLASLLLGVVLATLIKQSHAPNQQIIEQQDGLTISKTQPSERQEGTQVNAARNTSKIIGQSVPQFSLRDTNDIIRSPDQWLGSVLVINFWASWCTPCLREIPELVNANRSLSAQGVVFLGIAMDKLENILPFIDRLQMNYPSVYGQSSVLSLLGQFGHSNGGLPYTAIIDRKGHIVFTHAGPVTEKQLKYVMQQKGLL